MSSARPQQNLLLGIALRIGAAAGFSLMAALTKLGYEAGVSTPELIFYRFAFGLPPLLIWVAWNRNFTLWRTKRPGAHLWRAAVGLTAMLLSFTALKYLPLAEATTIGFAAPFFAVILSALLLQEKVGVYRWAAVATGFAGVLIVMQPEGSQLSSTGLALATLAALGTAFATIAIRHIGRTESTQTTVLWFSLISMLVIGLLMPFSAKFHDSEVWLLLFALGICGGLGQLFVTASLRYAPVPVLAPLDYTQLLWVVLLGWWLWQTQPAATTWAGAAVIIASSLFTLYREHRLGRRKEQSEVPL